MKRIIIALALMAAVMGASAAELVYIGNKTALFTVRIEKIDALAAKGNLYAALQSCRALEKDWENAARKIDILLIHDYVDAIGNNVSRMRSHLEHGSRMMYFAESTGAKKALASIKGSEYPKVENIL